MQVCVWLGACLNCIVCVGMCSVECLFDVFVLSWLLVFVIDLTCLRCGVYLCFCWLDMNVACVVPLFYCLLFGCLCLLCIIGLVVLMVAAYIAVEC